MRSHKERKRKKGQEREAEREGEGEVREKQHPEIQASINGAEHACIVAANSEWCINTGLVLGCPSKSVVYV